MRSSVFLFAHKLPCPVFYILPLLSSFYYLPCFLVLCNYILRRQTVKQGLLLKAFIISFSIVSSNTFSGFRLFFCSQPPEHMVVNMQHAVTSPGVYLQYICNVNNRLCVSQLITHQRLAEGRQIAGKEISKWCLD